MLFARSKVIEPVLEKRCKGMKPYLNGELSSDLMKQIEMIHLTKDDLKIVMYLKPLIEKNITTIVNDFYANIEKTPSLIKIINKFSAIDKLKGTLTTHIIEMFSGKIDEQFIKKRKE